MLSSTEASGGWDRHLLLWVGGQNEDTIPAQHWDKDSPETSPSILEKSLFLQSWVSVFNLAGGTPALRPNIETSRTTAQAGHPQMCPEHVSLPMPFEILPCRQPRC